MASEKKHYEVLISGDGINGYPMRTIDVCCTRENLEVVAQALKDYVYDMLGHGCCCLAKEGGGVTYSDFDIMFADCM